jgi:UDP-N-acetylmuramoyl-tripeptide--D-alanyl-D-alanine ligase
MDNIYAAFKSSLGVETDSRKDVKGKIFWSLRGPNFDGNDFALTALENGAAFAVCERPDVVHERVFHVEDALAALQNLARHHRRQLTLPILGLTGSNGKTTTKELLAAAFGKTAYATRGNRNNHIGLPLSVLEIDDSHSFAVLEMGDNRPGEIDFLCAIAQPTHALITNIGKDHLGHYADLNQNAQTKLALFEFVARAGGTLYVNADDPFLADYVHFSGTKFTYGLKTQADYSARPVKFGIEGMTVEVVQCATGRKAWVETPLWGEHNVENILAAATVCFSMDVSPTGLSAYRPQNNRSQIIHDGNKIYIADAYNANPSSVRAALDGARGFGRKLLAVLGDMHELGNHAVAEHRDLGKRIHKLKDVTALFVGPLMRYAHEAAPGSLYAPDLAAARQQLDLVIDDFEVVLFKGSRTMELERLIPNYRP